MYHDYIIVHFLSPLSVGYNFPKFPMHMTLIPPFDCPVQEYIMIEKIEECIEKSSKISTTITHHDMFGPDHDIPVSCLSKNPELMKLHKEILKVLYDDCGVVLPDPTFIYDEYTPHISHKQGSDPVVGEVLDINSVTLVKKVGDIKTVVVNWRLK